MPRKLPAISEGSAHRRDTIRSFKTKANNKRTSVDKFADLLTAGFGTVLFLVGNMLFFLCWLLWNAGVIKGLTPIDPISLRASHHSSLT
jgi:uncharacterized membrane protein